MDNLIKSIEKASDIYGLITFLLAASSFLFVGTLLFIFSLRKNWKLLQNLQRPIKIFFPEQATSHNMNMEYKSLVNTGFFKPEAPTNDYRDSLNLDHHSLVILGFDSSMKLEHFNDIIDIARTKRVPIIVYTFGENNTLLPVHWKKLNTHLWYSVANTPLRLISDVFTSLSTYTYGK